VFTELVVLVSLAAFMPAKVVVFTVTAVPYLMPFVTAEAVSLGLVRFTPVMFVVMLVVVPPELPLE
jgi:hypothetical protein